MKSQTKEQGEWPGYGGLSWEDQKIKRKQIHKRPRDVTRHEDDPKRTAEPLFLFSQFSYLFNYLEYS